MRHLHQVRGFLAHPARQAFLFIATAMLVLAVLMGSTLAWQQSKTRGHFLVKVGTLDWTASYSPVPNGKIGPDGAENLAGWVAVANNGTFNIRLKSGQVIVKNVDKGHTSCDAANFSGRMVSLFPGGVLAPHDTLADAFATLIMVRLNAPKSCMGATITYDVRFTMETAPNGPEPWKP